nr:hypothetical protein [Saprospiraceae bacterium]
MFSTHLKDQLLSFKNVLEQSDTSQVNANELLRVQYKNFELFYEIITEEFNANFTTLFTRITYIAALKIWPKGLIRLAHIIRRSHDDDQIPQDILSELLVIIPQYIDWHISAILDQDINAIMIPEVLLSYFNT